MNPLDNYPRVRAALYLVQWLVNGIITIGTVVFTFMYGVDNIDEWPRWFLGVGVVAPALWTYLGITAQQNTPALLRTPKHNHGTSGDFAWSDADAFDDPEPEDPGTALYRE